MSSEIAIRVRGLSKCYSMFDRPEDRLKQMLSLGRRKYCREFWAVRDVDLDAYRGETVGIVGRNGSGKSTLLQILCGTLSPTSGSVEINGRVAALLELGAGFNPEFTGHENVYMNGSILGLRKEEIEARFDEIAAFADIGDFIDQPVKTYSSGMYVRLAFAVSACVDPDVLIVDEALAVGDVKFQAKCFRRFEELVARGTTILLVTHSTEQIVRHCDKAILLESGRIHMEGAPKDVANRYLDLLFGVNRTQQTLSNGEDDSSTKFVIEDVMPNEDGFEKRAGYNPHEYRWGNREAEIIDFMVTTDGKNHISHIPSSVRTLVVMWVRVVKALSMPIYGLMIKTPDGITVYGCNSRDYSEGPMVEPVESGDVVRVVFHLDQRLGAGDYLISLGVAEERFGEIVPLDRRFDAVHVTVSNSMSRAFGVAEFNMWIEVSSSDGRSR